MEGRDPPDGAEAGFDARVVEHLCAQIGVDAVEEIVGMFLAALGEALPAIVVGCGERDRVVLARTAHRLKGGAANLGANDLRDLFDQLENEAVGADWPPLEELIVCIEALGGATRERLLAELVAARAHVPDGE